MINMEIERSSVPNKAPLLKRKKKRNSKKLQGKQAKLKKLIAQGKYKIDESAIAQKILEKGDLF